MSHDFHNQRSYLTYLLVFIHHFLDGFDQSKTVDIVHLDFLKTFHKVPYKQQSISKQYPR